MAEESKWAILSKTNNLITIVTAAITFLVSMVGWVWTVHTKSKTAIERADIAVTRADATLKKYSELDSRISNLTLSIQSTQKTSEERLLENSDSFNKNINKIQKAIIEPLLMPEYSEAIRGNKPIFAFNYYDSIQRLDPEYIKRMVFEVERFLVNEFKNEVLVKYPDYTHLLIHMRNDSDKNSAKPEQIRILAKIHYLLLVNILLVEHTGNRSRADFVEAFEKLKQFSIVYDEELFLENDLIPPEIQVVFENKNIAKDIRDKFHLVRSQFLPLIRPN